MGITKIIVITDVGEEIDDEVTLWYLDKVFANREDVTIDVLFVNGHMQSSKRLKRAKDLKLNEAEKLRYYQFLEYDYTFNKNERIIIVQIGPVEFSDNNKAKIEELTTNPFKYILLGDVGATLNSQKNAKATAEKFIEKSKQHYIVNSKINGELKVPSFRHDKIQMFPDVLKEEIYKLGFKNTVGRAPKIPFTRHLSGKGGANYEAVNAIYKIVNNNTNISTLDVPTEFITSANEYMNMNQYPSQQKTAEDFARKNNQEIDNQASDLAKMTYALKHLGFQPDHTIIYSDAIIDKTTKNIDPQYTDSFDKYKNLLKKHPSIKMTPAYDLVAGYLVYLLCSENDLIYDKFETNETNNYMYYTLKDYSNIGNILDPGKLGKCFRNEEECIKYISNNIGSLSFNDRNKIPTNLTTLNYARLNTIVKMINNNLNQQSGGSQTYTKTNKKFTYNNRNYVVYKYTKSKKEFIKIKGIETQTSSLQKQEYKNTKQKIEYKGKPYSIFEKLADKRRFILVNNKRSYLKTR